MFDLSKRQLINVGLVGSAVCFITLFVLVATGILEFDQFFTWDGTYVPGGVIASVKACSRTVTSEDVIRICVVKLEDGTEQTVGLDRNEDPQSLVGTTINDRSAYPYWKGLLTWILLPGIFLMLAFAVIVMVTL